MYVWYLIQFIDCVVLVFYKKVRDVGEEIKKKRISEMCEVTTNNNKKIINLSDVCVCKENKILPQDEKGMVLYAYLNANLPLL